MQLDLNDQNNSSPAQKIEKTTPLTCESMGNQFLRLNLPGMNLLNGLKKLR
jgi:hypothetical protein